MDAGAKQYGFFLGVGEGRDDLIPFNADDYIDTILDSIFTTNNG
jgi:fused signal recognition particle receptor